MEIIGAVFLVLSLAASQAQIEESPQLIRSLVDLFSESHIEPVVLLIDACAHARNYTEEPEVNHYRRTIDDLVDNAKSEYSSIDPSDDYYPMRAGELFRDLCGDMEIYFADVAVHVARHNRYDEYFFGKPKLPHPLRGSQKIVKTCLAHERQIQHGDGSAVRRGLYELVNSIGNTRLDIDQATSSAQNISDQFRIFCEAVAHLLQSLRPSTPPTPGYTYMPEFDLMYKVNMDDGQHWDDHNAACEADGGHLLTIKNETMFNWIKLELETYYPPTDGQYYHFDVDGNKANVNGAWVDSVGDALWLQTGFTAAGRNDHMSLITYSGQPYRMWAVTQSGPYSSRHGYVCQL